MDPHIFSISSILRFEKRCPKQNYCCSPKAKQFPKKILVCLRHCREIRLYGPLLDDKQKRVTQAPLAALVGSLGSFSHGSVETKH